jgi:esterase/lipase
MPFFLPPLISLGAALKMHIKKPESTDSNPYWQGYEVQPLVGVRALLRLNKETLARLPNINQPVFVAQGRNDKTVAPDCGDVIRAGVKTAVFQQHWFEHSGHIIIVEDEIDEIAERTIRFIKAIVNC